MNKMKKLSDYMKIKEAAEFLGMEPSTLRAWAKEKKIKSYEFPQVPAAYLFLKEDLEDVLRSITLLE